MRGHFRQCLSHLEISANNLQLQKMKMEDAEQSPRKGTLPHSHRFKTGSVSRLRLRVVRIAANLAESILLLCIEGVLRMVRRIPFGYDTTTGESGFEILFCFPVFSVYKNIKEGVLTKGK